MNGKTTQAKTFFVNFAFIIMVCFDEGIMQLLGYAYKQRNDWTCGPAVARVILHASGVRKDIRGITKELRTTREGTGNAHFLRLLKKHNLRYFAKENATAADIKKCLKRHLVVVAYWIPAHKESHYSIVKKINSKRIYFHDTWFGSNHSYSIKYFLKNWRDNEAYRWMLAVKK